MAKRLALNEIPAKRYYKNHLLEKDRKSLEAFTKQLGLWLVDKKVPCGIYAVGSSTWTETICRDHSMLFPRRYNDIDLRVVPINETEMVLVEAEILQILQNFKIPFFLDKRPREVGRPDPVSGYITLDYANTIDIKAHSNYPEMDLILRPKQAWGRLQRNLYRFAAFYYPIRNLTLQARQQARL